MGSAESNELPNNLAAHREVNVFFFNFHCGYLVWELKYFI